MKADDRSTRRNHGFISKSEITSSPSTTLSRRSFLGVLGVGAAFTATPAVADIIIPRERPTPAIPRLKPEMTVAGSAPTVNPVFSVQSRGPDHRRLTMVHMHTGERLKVLYHTSDGYISEALREVDHFMRDFRSQDVAEIDPHLLDFVHDVRGLLDFDREIEVLGGYRSPATNAMLRRTSRGVAKDSYHMKGAAADLRWPGRSLSKIRGAALSLDRGGVGYYPRRGFVHLDSGPARTWRG